MRQLDKGIIHLAKQLDVFKAIYSIQELEN